MGHVAYSPRDATESELVVFVDDSYQGRGIGTELCRQAIAHAADDGHESMKLHVGVGNKRAVSVYDSLGFRTIDERDDNIVMRLDMTGSVVDRVQAPPAEWL